MSGNVQFKVENGLLVRGNSNCENDFQVSGNVIVGGTLVYTGTAAGSIIPTANVTYSIGNSSLQWSEMFAANVTASASLSAPGLIANTTAIIASGSLLPSSNNGAFGNTTRRWDAYANNANLLSIGVSGLANLATVNTSGALAVGGVGTFTVNVNITGAVSIGGNAAVTGNSTLTGAAALSNTLTVAGAVTITSNTTLKANSSLTSFSLLGNNTVSNVTYTVNNYTITGLVSMANTLSVTGAANVGGTFGITGAANAFSTMGIVGATALSNTLTVAGAVTVTSNIVHKANASLTSYQLLGNNTVSNITFAVDTMGITGLVSMANTLSVTGLTTLSTANVTAQFDARAAANVAGALGVIGVATFSANITGTGTTLLTGNTTLKANSSLNTLVLQGNNTLSNVTITADALTVAAAASYTSTIAVSGAATLANISVSSAALVANTTRVSVTAGLFVNSGSKSVILSGNATYGNVAVDADVTTFTGNTNFRAGLLFVDGTNNRVGIKNTAPDADLKITGTANISGATVIGGALLVQGAFTNSLAVDHNALTNYVADQHVAHSTINIIAGAGLSGNGVITANVTHNVVAGNNTVVANSTGVWVVHSAIDHNALLNYVAAQHVSHTSVSLTAGNGLTGGGDISASRSFAVVAGTGVVSNSTGVHIDSTVVTLAGSQTLTNKTFTNPEQTAQTIADSNSVTWDCSLGGVGTITLGTVTGARAINNPTNKKVGTYILKVVQDGTGGRTIGTWGSNFKWALGVVPTLSTAINAVDVFSFFSDGTNMYGSMLKGMA